MWLEGERGEKAARGTGGCDEALLLYLLSPFEVKRGQSPDGSAADAIVRCNVPTDREEEKDGVEGREGSDGGRGGDENFSSFLSAEELSVERRWEMSFVTGHIVGDGGGEGGDWRRRWRRRRRRRPRP